MGRLLRENVVFDNTKDICMQNILYSPKGIVIWDTV